MTKRNTSVHNLDDALKDLLMGRKAATQEDLCLELAKLGYDINQSKASRLLRKIGAVKVTNEQGLIVYSLPREPAPPSMHTPLKDLIIDIVSNEVLVLIFTSPGSASMVARLLDYNQIKTEILGTIAGDDTIFVAPKSIQRIDRLLQEIRSLLQE